MYRILRGLIERRRFTPSDDTPPEAPLPTEEISIDLHDRIIEAVLESADKIVKDNDIKIGDDFTLPLTDVDVDADLTEHDIDFDVVLPAKTRDHGLLFIPNRQRDGTSLCFMRVGRLSSQMSSR